jgi:dolichol-phosphate mannosyltransferase
MPHLSIVTPVYRAEDCLEELYRRLVAVLSGMTRDFEIVMVEDCGGDRSWEIIRELARKDSRVKGIQFSRNFGQHYGITAGLDNCDGDWVVVMDCDLQDRPEDIPLLYAKAQEGYDVVHAQRDRHQDALVKRWGSNLYFKLLEYFADVAYETPGNFRILSRKVVENFRRLREQLRYSTGLLHWMGFPTAYVEVQQAERYAGKSTYTLAKLWKLAFEIMIAFSDKPLRLSVRLGFIIAFLAFCYGVTIFVRALLYGSAITGWASLIVSIYFIGGIIISILGVIGIYLGKTFEETKKRPLYIVMHTTFEGTRSDR